MINNDNDKKGFGGFNDLVSDITKEVEAPVTKRSPTVTEPSSKSLPNAQQDSPSRPVLPTQTHNSGNVPSGSSRTNWVWWVAGIFFIIAIAIGSGEKDADDFSTPPVTQQTVSDSYSSSTSPEVLSEPQPASVEVLNQEEMPPVGTGLVLSHNQIRYCLAEDMRLSTIQKSINSYSQYEVDTFNSVVQDYNSRCSNYRYRSGVLESVRSEVSLEYTSLATEALRTLESWREKSNEIENLVQKNALTSSENSQSSLEDSAVNQDSSESSDEEQRLTE